MIDRTVSQYKIIAKLGEGGMGTVYRGIDTMLDRPVAIKVLHAHISRQPDVINRFRSEAALLAKLNDPNIATLYAFFREGDEFFMVMELVVGETLASYMQKPANKSLEKAVGITSKILLGLEHAHSLGIQHRDIKPANILITAQEAVKITDFGIARALGSERLTRDQRLVGTLEYLAPERIKGEEGDLRSDLYSVGVVLYEMLSGHLPFERGTDFELMRAHLEEMPFPLRDLSKTVPPELEAFVLRSLAKKPEERFANAREMREALNAVELKPTEVLLPKTRFEEPKAAAGMPETRFAEAMPETRMADVLPETRFADTQGEGAPVSTPQAPAAPLSALYSRKPVLAGGGMLALILAGVGIWAVKRPAPEPASVQTAQSTAVAPAAGGFTPIVNPGADERPRLPLVVPPAKSSPAPSNAGTRHTLTPPMPKKKESPEELIQRGRSELASNPAAARASFQQAADGGSSAAMVLLGAMYAQGEGGEQSYPEALKLFMKAATMGNIRGMFNAGLLYEGNKGMPNTPNNQVAAAKLYGAAVKSGNSPDAAYRLGIMYEQGRGVGQDLNEAKRLYRLAGTQEAIARLQRISQ